MSHLHYQIVYAAEFAFMAAVYALAFWRGNGLVRRVAAIMLAEQVIVLVGWLAFHTSRGFVAVIDAACLTLTVLLAVREPRPWLLCACAFLLAGVATYVAYLLDARIDHLAMATAGNTWSMLWVAALLWGAVEAWRKTPRRLAPEAA